jgi:hypothetical protein
LDEFRESQLQVFAENVQVILPFIADVDAWQT